MTNMENAPTHHRETRADYLAIGFGTTVAMWAAGYACRFPPVIVPSWLLLLLMLACLFGGGFVMGRHTSRTWRSGACVGMLSAALNLLILGSLLTGDQPNRIVPSALWWIPGSMMVAGVLGAAGAVAGSVSRRADTHCSNWTAVFAKVGAVATLMLLVAGGVVTGKEAGLAVVDWPNSFGYNMFLYPLSRMTGGVYYEHSHRLLGSLVGLTTLVLAIHLQRTERRRWLRRFAWFALLAVVIQGILGGLRVTGRLTLSTSPEDTAPSIILAIVHGVLGQAFFGMIVAIAVFTSSSWQRDRVSTVTRSARTDRILGIILTVALVVQLVFGAILRHVTAGLLIHISLAVVVVLVALICALRAWGLHEGMPPLPSLGRALMPLVGLQVALGIAALIAVGIRPADSPPSTSDVILTTTHQAVGAVLLACVVTLMAWCHRLLEPEARQATSCSPGGI